MKPEALRKAHFQCYRSLCFFLIFFLSMYKNFILVFCLGQDRLDSCLKIHWHKFGVRKIIKFVKILVLFHIFTNKMLVSSDWQLNLSSLSFCRPVIIDPGKTGTAY